ncbi:hypothetical protein LTS18_011625, partial [Coniosporium uncinatum]
MLTLPRNSSTKRKSVTFSENEDIVRSDALDTWITTLDSHSSSDWKEASITSINVPSRNVSTRGKRSSRSSSSNLCLRSSGSWLCHSYEPGFPVALIDEPDIERFAGAKDPTAALRGNPPTPKPKLTIPQRDGSGKTLQDAAIIVPKQYQRPRCERLASYPDDNPPVETPSVTDRMSDQGMRRPTPTSEEITPTYAERELHHMRSESGLPVKHCRLDSRVDSLMTPSSRPTSPKENQPDALQPKQQSREDRIRVRKVRDLQRMKANGSIDEIVHRPFTAPATQMESETIRVSLEGSDPVYFPRIQRKPVGDRHKHRPSELAVIRAEGSPARRTGYTPKTGNMTLSPVMLVAEQIPVAKSKHVRKPARLVLRERNDMRPVAIAVRAQDSRVSTHTELVSGAASQSASGETVENGTACALQPVTTVYVQAPSPVTAEPTGPIPEPPSR